MKRDSTERAFLKAIQEQPGDVVSRLVYADWLDEHGRAVEAFAYRWAVAHGKYPACFYGYDGKQWFWFALASTQPLAHCLPEAVWKGLRSSSLLLQWPYHNLDVAYRDLGRALNKLRQLLKVRLPAK